MDFFQFQSVAEAEQGAREALREVLLSTGDPVLLLLSGGSALRLLDGLEDVAVKIAPRLTISVLDERYSSDPNVNNFAQIMETEFCCRAIEHGAGIIDTRPGMLAHTAWEGKQLFSRLPFGALEPAPHPDVEKSSFPPKLGDLDEFARRFERALRTWRRENPSGKIVITQGIGPDGHTAGIFPCPEDPEFFRKTFDETKQWVVGYDAGVKNQYPLRATVTFRFLREQVDSAIVFAAGKDKYAALERVCASDGALAETPARIVREMNDVRMFLME